MDWVREGAEISYFNQAHTGTGLAATFIVYSLELWLVSAWLNK